MSPLKCLRQIFLYFFRGFTKPPVARCRPQPEAPEFVDDLSPGFTGIETQISGQPIDGTVRWIGQDARVGQMPNGEMVTLERERNIRCGCGHLASSLEEVVTPNRIYRGIGGICHDCDVEAQELRSRNAVSLAQADGLSLYCTRCASHCDNCGRQNLCKRHTRTFTDAQGQKLLCPECFKKAERKRLFYQTVNAATWLLADDNTSSKSRRRGDSDDD